MPITKQQATTERWFHYSPRCELRAGHTGLAKDRPTIERWKANGACQTWKTRPDEFRLPLKHGMYAYGELTDRNAHEFHLEGECPHGFGSNPQSCLPSMGEGK